MQDMEKISYRSGSRSRPNFDADPVPGKMDAVPGKSKKIGKKSFISHALCV